MAVHEYISSKNNLTLHTFFRFTPGSDFILYYVPNIKKIVPAVEVKRNIHLHMMYPLKEVMLTYDSHGCTQQHQQQPGGERAARVPQALRAHLATDHL